MRQKLTGKKLKDYESWWIIMWLIDIIFVIRTVHAVKIEKKR